MVDFIIKDGCMRYEKDAPVFNKELEQLYDIQKYINKRIRLLRDES